VHKLLARSLLQLDQMDMSDTPAQPSPGSDELHDTSEGEGATMMHAPSLLSLLNLDRRNSLEGGEEEEEEEEEDAEGHKGGAAEEDKVRGS
jgi:hypothetical protein